MSEKELFSKLGLTERESEIYRALLRHGSMKLSRLSRETGIHRPALYTLMPQMIEKKLVSKSARGKQTIFVPEHPETLVEMLHKTTDELTTELPNLARLYEGYAKRPTVRYFEGKEGIRKIHEDVVGTLKRGATFYRYSSPSRSRRDADSYLPKDYRKRRDEKKLERLVITGAWVAAEKKPRLERHIKVLDEIDKNDFEVTTIIYGNKVAMIDYSAETALIIESAGIARFQKAIFLQLYRRL